MNPRKETTQLKSLRGNPIPRHFSLSPYILSLRKEEVITSIPVIHHKPWRPSLTQQGATLVLLAVLGASSFGVTYGNLNSTVAYFKDEEVSKANVLSAGSLDFATAPDGSVEVIIELGESLQVPVMTPEPGSFPIMYRVIVEETDLDQNGPNLLCSLLDVNAVAPPFTYTGDLLTLSVEPSSVSGAWNVTFSLPDVAGLIQGDVCTFDLVYRGWHKDVPENTGYTDEERTSFTFMYEEGEVFLRLAPEALVAPLQEEAPTPPEDGPTNGGSSDTTDADASLGDETPETIEEDETSTSTPEVSGDEPSSGGGGDTTETEAEVPAEEDGEETPLEDTETNDLVEETTEVPDLEEVEEITEEAVVPEEEEVAEPEEETSEQTQNGVQEEGSESEGEPPPSE